MNTDFEQQLRGAMERFTDDVRVPPGLALKACRQRQKRRMTGRAAAAAGTATVVAGSLAVAGAAGAFGSARRPARPRPPTPPTWCATWSTRWAARRMGNLVERTAPCSRPAPACSRSCTTGLIGSPHGPGGQLLWTAGYTLRWSYRASHRVRRFSASGQRVFDWGSARRGREHGGALRNGTWWTAPAAGGGLGGTRPGPAGCLRGGEILLTPGRATAGRASSGPSWPAAPTPWRAGR